MIWVIGHHKAGYGDKGENVITVMKVIRVMKMEWRMVENVIRVITVIRV